MNIGASAANVLWLARSRAAERRFAAAVREPQQAQEALLRAQLTRHATSAFGRLHDFASITTAAEFSRRVPLTDYDDVAPWMERVRSGERDLLACGRVTHLAPTSGTSGARKLIPFSRSLQEAFDAAVGAWMVDLARQRPALRWGPAYWSVSPVGADDASDDADSNQQESIPIGFADDADYLGGAGAWLVRRALAAPSSLRHVRDISTFWRLTLLALLRQRELRVISVWHPSFLDLLVGAAESQWNALLDDMPRRRAAELRRVGPCDWPRWWPRLQVVSCWGEQAALPGYRRLAARLPHLLVQPKGLLATEAVVTIPYQGLMPLAVCSHYFEFLDGAGDVRAAHELEPGGCYEVVVTNGGGLWRYRLGDMVECTAHLHATPALRFLGRASQQSDLRGEKLGEAFVAGVLQSLWEGAASPTYLALCARDSAAGAGYELLVSAADMTEPAGQLSARLDRALGENPHYAIARRLGQLCAPEIVSVPEDHAAGELAAHAGRLGDAKPRLLIPAEVHQP
jgi:hypothetical protein